MSLIGVPTIVFVPDGSDQIELLIFYLLLLFNTIFSAPEVFAFARTTSSTPILEVYHNTLRFRLVRNILQVHKGLPLYRRRQELCNPRRSSR